MPCPAASLPVASSCPRSSSRQPNARSCVGEENSGSCSPCYKMRSRAGSGTVTRRPVVDVASLARPMRGLRHRTQAGYTPLSASVRCWIWTPIIFVGDSETGNASSRTRRRCRAGCGGGWWRDSPAGLRKRYCSFQCSEGSVVVWTETTLRDAVQATLGAARRGGESRTLSAYLCGRLRGV
jgi:hypothetical protein